MIHVTNSFSNFFYETVYENQSTMKQALSFKLLQIHIYICIILQLVIKIFHQ